MKSKFTLLAFGVFAIFLMASCSKALSDQHVKYLGQWGDNKYSLEIWKNGRGVYQKKQQEPIECVVQIKNNRIKFKGIKSFDIDSDPYFDNNGNEVMVLDGRLFYKH